MTQKKKILRKREREEPINKTVNDLQWRWNSETYEKKKMVKQWWMRS